MHENRVSLLNETRVLSEEMILTLSNLLFGDHAYNTRYSVQREIKRVFVRKIMPGPVCNPIYSLKALA